MIVHTSVSVGQTLSVSQQQASTSQRQGRLTAVSTAYHAGLHVGSVTMFDILLTSAPLCVLQQKETKKTRAASPHRDNGPDNSGVAAPHLPHPSLNHSGVAAAPRPPKGGMDQSTDASAPPRLARGSHNGGGAATSLPAPWPVKRTLSAPSPWQPGDSSSAASPSAAARAPSVASGYAATAEALTPVIRGRRADAASPTRASSISGAAVTALPVRGEKGGGREGNPGHGIKREGGENGDGGVDKKDGDGVQMDE